MQKYIGKGVFHKLFGNGIIKEVVGKIIIIAFENDEKSERKLTIDMFKNGVLEIKDAECMSEVKTMFAQEKNMEIIAEYNRLVALIPNYEKFKPEYIEAVLAVRNYYNTYNEYLNKVDYKEVADLVIEIDDYRRALPAANNNHNNNNRNNDNHRNINTERNLIFKVNYCDGGIALNGIGFNGLCSRELMVRNVDHRCNMFECCRYINGLISENELRSNRNNVCYENHLFSNWKIGSGKRGGIPQALNKGNVGGVTFIASKGLGDINDNTLYIIGAFIIDELCRNGANYNIPGFVKCNSDFKITLKNDEAIKLELSRFYEPWRRSLYKDISDEISINILNCMKEVIQDENRKKIVQSIINKLNNVQ